MRLFFVSDTGTYAAECSVYRAEDREALEKLLPPINRLGNMFDEREIVELSTEGPAEMVYSGGYSE